MYKNIKHVECQTMTTAIGGKIRKKSDEINQAQRELYCQSNGVICMCKYIQEISSEKVTLGQRLKKRYIIQLCFS